MNRCGMVDSLNELRAELSTAQEELRDAEDELRILRDKAAKSIAAVESQEGAVELLRNRMRSLENEILHQSGF